MSYPNVPESLYRPQFEHDACGVGFVANTNGRKERRIVEYALQALCNLAHRGALDADAKTGDGAGILVQLPKPFFRQEAEKLGAQVDNEDDLAVGFVFLPRDNPEQAQRCEDLVDEAAAKFGIRKLGWRTVPVNPDCLGDKARATQPLMKQFLMARDEGWSGEEYERRLYMVRKFAGNRIRGEDINEFYIASFSSRTITYKGLFNAPQVPKFYSDLRHPEFVTSLAIYHQRYSTNTFPNWRLAHPYRMVAHNGEINTLLGNVNWVRAREQELASEVWGENIEYIKPLIQPGSSDSACLDNILEILSLSGRDILHSALMMVPEAWEKMEDMDPRLKAFYQYHACVQEPWDGPAAVIFTDGRTVGACLDRNGLRPARYKRYQDGLVVMGSEVGVVELPDSEVVEKGRLGPGKILAVDTSSGEFLDDEAVKMRVAGRQPYEDWCRKELFLLGEHAKPFAPSYNPVNILDHTLQQIAFGWDNEEIEMVVRPMAASGAEPVGSMGDDTPLAVLSQKPRLLYYYFRQLFAQVTNPPIDSIREKIVMSLGSPIGRRGNWLGEGPEHARMVWLESPFMLDYELEALRQIEGEAFQSETIYCHFDAKKGAGHMTVALEEICEAASKATAAGKSIIILSDRNTTADNVPVPMLVAVGAVHHSLIRAGQRLKVSILCETGEARDVHQFACLIGFGASAVNPYVAIDTIREAVESGEMDGVSLGMAIGNYRKAIQNGILKIMSKMGISTVASYRGAQIFEAVGISEEVMEKCFFGTVSQIGGVTLEQIAEDALRRHQKAYSSPEEAELEEGGNWKVLPGDRGEFHAFNKPVIKAFNTFIRTTKRDDYLKYSQTSDSRPPVAPRDLLRFVETAAPIPLDEVEPIENIRRRFTTAGMSLGALSKEAHECLAIAMNKIGGKSNSGEGGEDSERFNPRSNGDNACSAIKQVASGRFGVTPEYLASAQEIEIKMAQGAKPGEGGQLPGHKVNAYIARLRHSTPGVPLISPPPHHDIYSIEDLAQLIYDLKQVNPRAKVCVKLVACAGVGTVAAGVAKAYADVVLISGHDGGTGASPMSSIKYAGVPWELGVAEAHQTLMLNDLRSRIVLRTDGGMKTGRDIVMAALLGAEEYNFGTAALISAGCAMFRVCHLNTCPVGVATQKDELRKKFRGKPENVISFFNGVAEEVREIMAQLGIRKVDDLVGRTELVERRPAGEFPEILRPRIANITLDRMLHRMDPTGNSTRIHTRERNERFGDVALDDRIVNDAKVALNHKGAVKLEYDIRNIHRNIGTRVAGMIGYTYGDQGLPDGSIDITFRGSAGQSFGTFMANGMRWKLIGEANDYVGKGMNGGEIVVRPPEDVKWCWSDNQIVGNTVMYGATGGRLFAAGRGGERFCVRNSGGTAVVEGVGDHGCEYMTGGTVVVLGGIGRNFGAGMSGGLAYIYDPGEKVPKRYNPAMVDVVRLEKEEDIGQLRALVEEHAGKTGSPRAGRILQNWKDSVKTFWKVVPHPPSARPSGKPVHEMEKEKTKPAPAGGF